MNLLKRRKDFYSRFCEAKIQKGWGELSQVELGKRLGCSQSLISKWKKFEGLPSMDLAIQVASSLGVNTEWLLSGRGEKYPEKDFETGSTVIQMMRGLPEHLNAEVVEFTDFIKTKYEQSR